MDLFEQELAEVLAMRYPLPCYGGNPVVPRSLGKSSSETWRRSRLLSRSTITTSQSILALRPGALQKLVARAITLRLSDWVELTVANGTITLTINETRRLKPPKLDGCYVLKNRPDPHASTQRDGP